MLNETTKRWLHNQRYINFKNKNHAESKVEKKLPFYEQLEEIKNKGMKQIKHTTVRVDFKRNRFALTETGNYLRLTWHDDKGFHQRYTNFRDDSKNEDRVKGQAISTVKKMFKARTQVSFKDAFGEVPQYYKRCVPGLFHYDNPLFKKDKGISSAARVDKYDFTSHFPACACGKLPDARTAVTVDGYVMPTEEYPFAFYTNGFVAEYGQYDSRDWYLSPYGKSLFETEDDTGKRRLYPVNVHPSVKETVLMKASEYQINEEMAYFYEQKAKMPKGSKEREDAKVVLLKIIGQMEQNDMRGYRNNPYAHLAAVIKCRAIHRMMQLIEKIGHENVIQVIVDGILWQNWLKKHYEDKEEFLGSLKLERFQTTGTFKGHNQYVLKDKDDYEIAHAGYDLNIGPDMTQWGKSPAMNLKKRITELGIDIELMFRDDFVEMMEEEENE